MNEQLQQGIRCLEQGRLVEAQRLFEAILAREPDNPDALRHLGLVALMAGENAAALDLLGAAVERAPRVAGARINLAQALQAGGRLDAAVAEYRRAIELAPDVAPAHNLLGTALVAQRHHEAAAAAFTRALQLAPGLANASSNLGAVLVVLGDHAGAADAYRRVVALSPEDAGAWNELGNALQSLQREDEALAAYRRAVELAPDSAQALCNLGTMLQASGSLEQSAVAYERAMELAPGATEPPYLLATARLAQGEAESALAANERCLALRPHGQEALALKAFVLRELGRDDEAQRLLDFDRLLRVVRLPTPPGWASMEAFNQALSRHVLAHPSLTPDPFGASTRHGRHSADLLVGDKGPAAALETLVKAAFADYVRDLPQDDGHPFLSRQHERCQLVVQANLLDPGGYLISHVHPAAWVSGAYYLRMPAALGAGGDDRAGWLEFGNPPPGVVLTRAPATHAVRPQAGTLVLFPSYFYHGTVPLPDDLAGESVRISVGIDLIPTH